MFIRMVSLDNHKWPIVFSLSFYMTKADKRQSEKVKDEKISKQDNLSLPLKLTENSKNDLIILIHADLTGFEFVWFQWVPDTGLKHSTPIKIDTKHQFAPSNIDPKELKIHQKQVRACFSSVVSLHVSNGYSRWRKIDSMRKSLLDINRKSLKTQAGMMCHKWRFALVFPAGDWLRMDWSRILINHPMNRWWSSEPHRKVLSNAINRTTPWFTNLTTLKIRSLTWTMMKWRNINAKSSKIKCANKVSSEWSRSDKRSMFIFYVQHGRKIRSLMKFERVSSQEKKERRPLMLLIRSLHLSFYDH